MSVAVNTPTPFFPITSLQLQHLQAVTHSFAQRRPIISSVFNNFRTLSVATGVVPLPVRFFVASELATSALLCFHVVTNCFFFSERPALPRDVSFNLTCPSAPSTQTNERLRRCFPLEKIRNSYVALSPFNAVYRHSMHGNTVRRKVWSHTANSGRLDTETFGGSAQLFHRWLHLRMAGRHKLTSNN
jgi:hypothetical protein